MLKKILFVHHAGGMSGASRSLAFLINNLDRTKYTPIVWMMRGGETYQLLKATGALIIVNKSKWLQPFDGTTVSGMSLELFLKNLIGLFPTYLAARKIIKKINPDVIHLSTTCLFHFAFAAKRISKDIKVISHIREPLLPNIFGKILLKANSKYVDKFIAICQNDARPFIEYGQDVKIVFNFVNLKDYNKDLNVRVRVRQKLELTDNFIMVSSFARVAPSNGILDLIQIAKLCRKNPNIIFFVFGYAGTTKYEREVREQSPDNVKLMPIVRNVAEYMNATDILLSPFKTPHFSRAIVEASAIGIPTIASNVASQNELLVDKLTGYLYDSNEDAAQKIMKLSYDKKIRIEMGINALQFAKDNFDSQKNSLETFKAYD